MLHFVRVILNEVKNLKTQSGCKQILRDAQDDTADAVLFLRIAKIKQR